MFGIINTKSHTKWIENEIILYFLRLYEEWILIPSSLMHKKLFTRKVISYLYYTFHHFFFSPAGISCVILFISLYLSLIITFFANVINVCFWIFNWWPQDVSHGWSPLNLHLSLKSFVLERNSQFQHLKNTAFNYDFSNHMITYLFPKTDISSYYHFLIL